MRLLQEAGHLPLAYLTAATHGLAEQAESLAAQLEQANLPLPTALTDAPTMLYPALYAG